MDTRTQRERMHAGELYEALDPELVAARARARDLWWTLNATLESQQDERRRRARVLQLQLHRLDAELRRKQEYGKPAAIHAVSCAALAAPLQVPDSSSLA